MNIFNESDKRIAAAEENVSLKMYRYGYGIKKIIPFNKIKYRSFHSHKLLLI